MSITNKIVNIIVHPKAITLALGFELTFAVAVSIRMFYKVLNSECIASYPKTVVIDHISSGANHER